MFSDNDNLRDISKNTIKDPERKLAASYGAGSQKMSVINAYSKLNKLITALYIVTDIMDSAEPIRLKLRTLGLEILSDINSISRSEMSEKIKTTLSFLDIALAIRLVSEMNFNILTKEFNELARSLQPESEKNQVSPAWLEEFLDETPLLDKEGVGGGNSNITTSPFGHSSSTRRREGELTPNILKKQRREDIMKAIRANGGSATITEVKAKASPALASCGEKTLQRELVSMVKDNILKKEGSKRWSKYFLA